MISRRTLAATLLAAGALTSGDAHAQWKPTRDVEFVIPFGLGGGSDLLARTIIKVITEEKLNPTAVVAVNKPGGGSAVGIGYVAASKQRDPHTLVLLNAPAQITPLMTPNARGWRDLKPVANFMLDDYLLFVRAASPYKTASALVADAKTKPPRTLSVGAGGTADELAVGVLEAGTGIKLNIIKFNSGGEVLTALLGGHIDAAVGNPLEIVGQLQSKAVVGLGVFRDARFGMLPDIATLKEQGLAVENFQMWRGVALPKDAPAEAVAYWQDVMRKVAAAKGMREYIVNNVAAEHLLVGAEFEGFLERQEKLYRETMTALGIIK
jgi:putative tricarboxylic transport membrane protein